MYFKRIQISGFVDKKATFFVTSAARIYIYVFIGYPRSTHFHPTVFINLYSTKFIFIYMFEIKENVSEKCLLYKVQSKIYEQSKINDWGQISLTDFCPIR